MATSTATFVTMNCKFNSLGQLTLTSPEGTKSITLATSRLKECDDNAQRIINEILALGEIPGIEFRCDVEIPELKLLAGLPIVTKLVSPQQPKTLEKVNAAQDTKLHRLAGRMRGTPVETSENDIVQHARNIETLKNRVSIWDQKFWTVEYDIPQRVSNHKDSEMKVCNPSSWLWRFAMRKSLSCWFVPEESMKQPAVIEWLADAQEKGCTIIDLELAQGQVEKLKAIAIKEFSKYVRELHTSLIKKIGTADETLKKIQDAEGPHTEKELAKAQTIRDCSVRTHIRTAGESLNVAIECAEKFDCTEDVADLLDALRNVIRSQAAVFNAYAAKKGITAAPMPK